MRTKTVCLTLIVLALIAADLFAGSLGQSVRQQREWGFADSCGLVYAAFYLWRGEGK